MRVVMPNKKRPVYFVEQPGQFGEMCFTFDGKKVFYLFQDYPYALKPREKEIFDKEFPFWADFFKDRTMDGKQNE